MYFCSRSQRLPPVKLNKADEKVYTMVHNNAAGYGKPACAGQL